MPTVRLQYRPGIDVERSPSLNRGGWTASNLCRFRMGVAESMLGWKRYVNSSVVGIGRALHWWQDLSGSTWIGVGTTDKLYLVQIGDFVEITPVGFTGAANWTLDNFGQNLIACPSGQGLFLWTPGVPILPASQITQAPLMNGAFVVMPTQIVLAYGCAPLAGGAIDPLLVRWCDQSDYTAWSPTTTNQAGSYRLSRGSRIVGGLQMPGHSVIWTDTDVWTGQYIGFPLVFSFMLAESNCGLIGQHAATILGDTVYWMSDHGFFRLGPQGIQQIPCSVWDVVYKDIDPNNRVNCVAGTDYHYSEVWFFFPSLGRDIDSYVKFNVAENAWDYGAATDSAVNPMARSAWTDQNQPGNPLSMDSRGYLVQAETGFTADDEGAISGSIRSGYQDLSEGRDIVLVDQFIPDFLWDGPTPEIAVTFYFRNWPSDQPTTIGPFSVKPDTEFVTLRLERKVKVGNKTITAYPAPRAREVAIQIDTVSGWWRWGAPRLCTAMAGRSP